MNSIDARIQAVAEIMRGKHLDDIQSESVYLMGVADKALSDRIIAFGAIRRAAAVARHHEYEARIIECASTDFAKRLAAEHFCLAKAVRRAIRAAIESDKA